MRTNLIKHMHDLTRNLAAADPLPAPFDRRGFFTSAQMTQIIGRSPNHADGLPLHLLNWTRSVRKINGVTQRVWFPPGADPLSQFDAEMRM